LFYTALPSSLEVISCDSLSASLLRSVFAAAEAAAI